MSPRIVGWDVGGAHLKAVLLNEQGRIATAHQVACPLWQGLEHLDRALGLMLTALPDDSSTHHVITMTGELTDHFATRQEGVMALTRAMMRGLGTGRVKVFRGDEGLIGAEAMQLADTLKIASANWLATGLWAATRIHEGILVDMGSTTTDLLTISASRVLYRGYTDSERLRYDELIYSGIIRTPVMILAKKAPLDGAWSGVMAEYFASMADVYRLTGELPEAADQMPAADQGPKTPRGSGQRLARQFGWDAEMLPDERWLELATHLREQQLILLHKAISLQLSRGLLGPTAPLIGAGVGRFLVRTLAQRCGRPYVDFNDLLPVVASATGFSAADCGPAAALACLASLELQPGS